jgi:hypothetical protein
MGGSRIARRVCRLNAVSGSVLAAGGYFGRSLNKERRWGGSEAIESVRSLEIEGADPSEDDKLLSDAKRLGNIKCCIQYDVPPTTIGICLLLWVSSIYNTVFIFCHLGY